MTVTYSREVTKAGVGVFLKLLARWRGSIYKIVWVELLIYLIIYYSLNIIYLYCLNEQYGQRHFINIVTYFSKYGSSIPLSFVLGFYVNIVYNRWWSQYSTIPYPDNIAILVGASVSGQLFSGLYAPPSAGLHTKICRILSNTVRQPNTWFDCRKLLLMQFDMVSFKDLLFRKEDKPRMIRRAIIRYVCAAFTITLTMISPQVKKRFPTINHLVQAGLLNIQEKKLMEELDSEYPSYKKYWLPLAWAANVSTRAKSEGLIKDEMGLKDILEQINEFREKCKKLCDYDWICIPLVYTQVVTLAVYLYFLFTAIGTQFVEEQAEGETSIFKFPFMSCVEFFFYMGWLKVAESLINPFGDDDDDFEVNWMVDRHLQVGYLLVDKIHNQHPKLTKDPHWDETAPNQLPFTVATRKHIFEHPVESTSKISVKQKDQDLVFRDDIEKSDEHTSQNVGKSIRKIFARKNPEPAYNLKRVTLKSDEDEEWDDFNIYEEDEIPENADVSQNHIANTEDFNLLRKKRIDRRKEYLLKCLEIFKDDKEQARKILDEIFK